MVCFNFDLLEFISSTRSNTIYRFRLNAIIFLETIADFNYQKPDSFNLLQMEPTMFRPYESRDSYHMFEGPTASGFVIEQST